MKLLSFVIAGLLLLVLCMPVSATLLNCTAVVPTDYNGDVYQDIFTLKTSYLFQPPTGNVIPLVTFAYDTTPSPTTPVYFKFTQAHGEQITGSIVADTGYLYGRINTTFDGGTSGLGSNYFNLYYLMSSTSFFYVYANSTNKYYLVAIDTTRFNFNPQEVSRSGTVGQVDIDTTNDAYIEITGKPYDNPIVKVELVGSGLNTFHGQTFYEPLQTIQGHVSDTETYAKNQSPDNIGGWIDYLIKLISNILSVAMKLATYAAGFGVFIIAGAGFLLLGKLFLTAWVAYTIVTAILSLNSDFFSTIKKIVQYQTKFLKFFMEIFGHVKDIVKWW